jgi:hypothetical protein
MTTPDPYNHLSVSDRLQLLVFEAELAHLPRSLIAAISDRARQHRIGGFWAQSSGWSAGSLPLTSGGPDPAVGLNVKIGVRVAELEGSTIATRSAKRLEKGLGPAILSA